MSRTYATPTRVRIRSLLTAEGPLSASDIAAALELTGSCVSGLIRRWREAYPDALHIVEWKRVVGRGGRWGAVWALGKGPDAPQPVYDAAQAHREWRERHALRLRIKSRAKAGKPTPAWMLPLPAATALQHVKRKEKPA